MKFNLESVDTTATFLKYPITNREIIEKTKVITLSGTSDLR